MCTYCGYIPSNFICKIGASFVYDNFVFVVAKLRRYVNYLLVSIMTTMTKIITKIMYETYVVMLKYFLYIPT